MSKSNVLPKQSHRVLIGIVISLSTLCVMFGILEIGARTYSWWLGKGFWMRPHSFTTPFFTTYDWPPPLIEGDQGTFRTGQAIPIVKPENELRVITLGGSTTVNARNAEGITYSDEIQKALQNGFPGYRVRVLNAGGDAFSTAHSLVNFSLRLLDFEPDVITIYHNINDLSALEFGERLLPDYSNKYLDDGFLAFEHRGGLGGTLLRFSRGMQFLRWKVRLVKTTLESSTRGSGVQNPEDGKRIFRRNLESLIAIAQHHGVEVILITQAHRDGDYGNFAAYNEEVRQAAQKNNIEIVDASQAMSGKEDLFLDQVHFTSEGVRTLACISQFKN